ncbi:MAG: HIT family protein [Candidatus Promineifilaceae bacterium]|nr:HIT family protein [Candidatus Promineifilaceae bacterium]
MNNPCQSCELVARRDAGEAPLWDHIFRAQYWDVVHSYNTSIPGWIVLVARQHHAAIAELSDEEAAEYGLLQQRVSRALAQVTGCVKTYVMQFAEHPLHPHVHFHVVPRMADQPPQRRSAGMLNFLGVPQEERLSDAEMNEIGAQLQRLLSEA